MRIITLIIIVKLSVNSKDFLRSLVKSLKIKFLHPMRRSMRVLSIKMRNFKELQNDIFNQQSCGFFQSSIFRNSSPKVFYKNVAFNTFEKFTGKQVCRSCKLNFNKNRLRHACFSVNIRQHFEEHLFCKTHTHGCF